MPEDITLLSARRAYEFRQDDIRLTMLSTGPVRQLIEKSFDFQVSTIAKPPQTFGSVAATDPPGLVFSLGSIPSTGGGATPVRFLHIEPSRVVVDVAGHSSAIDSVWTKLRAILEGVRTPDGKPVLGEPTGRQEQSQLRARLAFPPERILAPALRGMFQTLAAGLLPAGKWTFVPSLVARLQTKDAPYGPGIGPFQLELRAGESLDSNIYFSHAPFPSEVHLGYLGQVEHALSSGQEA